ncbi:hypothetical protein RHSIM_Rhsim10G0149200 [Rhododendron simsii]|uniref:Cytochrome P450 n=1 Tax=Rhododendron simsii TaxID=118357 RepID=A0A834LED6_RHOSS|nr:hypothetical protein RHSIM_Rhsim10G0149200 [Rhododendron simsii]
MKMLVTADPAKVRYVTSINFQNFPKGLQFRKIFDVLGDRIFNNDGDSWQSQRKLAQLHMGHRGFQQFSVKSTLDKMEKGLIPYLEQICQPGLVVDLQDLFQRLTFDTTCILLQRWLVIGQEKKYREAWATVDHIQARYINEKREELRFGINSKEEGEGVDLSTSYLKNDGIMGVKCDDKFLRDTMLTLMAAGQDTVSSVLTWFLWVVSTHPIVEARIREELEASIPKEVAFEEKEPHQSDILPSGHHVHPKLRILFSISAMGRMKFIWGEDCLEFKPERWITKEGMTRHEPSSKFFAFNAGPRTCLRKDMAFTQINLVAAAIILFIPVFGTTDRIGLAVIEILFQPPPAFPSCQGRRNKEQGQNLKIMELLEERYRREKAKAEVELIRNQHREPTPEQPEETRPKLEAIQG